MTAADTPGAGGSGAPADHAHAGGELPGEPVTVPRPASPTGGPLGSMVGLDTIRNAVEDTFELRINAYLAEVRRSRPGIVDPPLHDFHDWVMQPGPSSTPNPANAPRWTVVVPGTLGPPRRKGDGSMGAMFLARVQLWLWGKAWRDCDTRLGAYLVAARTCLLQNGRMGGVARSITWRGETILPAQESGTHTLGQATLEFAVWVDPVGHMWAGPAPLDPSVPPLQATPITGVGIDITAAPLDP